MAGITPEALLAEATWLKRLALTLAGDRDDADDLVQESWIAAWRRNPDTVRSLRPWLGKVVRDRSKMRRRAEHRRVQREASSVDTARGVSPDELLDQVRLHRLLVDLVLELEEPYRATVLARFVEGQTSASIAKRLDVAESTVRWRLHEALTRLRSRLDEINGDRKGWAPAVLVVAQKGMVVAKSTKVGVGFAVLVLLLFGGIAAWWSQVRRPDAPQNVAIRPTAPVGPGSKRASDWESDALPQLKSEKRPPGWFAQEGVGERKIAGVVLVDGAPANGAVVRLEDEASRSGIVRGRQMRTGPDGHFDFGVQRATRFDLGAFVPGRVATVKHIDLRNPRVDSEHVVVLLDPCSAGLYGTVVDASGGPIEHAQILAQGVIGTETDAQGTFDLCVDAQGNTPEDRRLLVRASGYGSVEMIAPLVGRVRHDFMLTPEATMTGRVVNTNGNGIPMANVRVSWDEAAPRPGSEQPAAVRCVSDSNGRFEIVAVSAGRLRIQASARGLAAPPTTIDIAPGQVKDIRLVVTERAVIRGRVSSQGKPIGGVSVYDHAELPTYQARAQVASAINEAVSQEDGSFVLDDLPIGTVALRTSPYGLRGPLSIELRPGEQSIELEVEQLATLTGTVRRNGKTVPHALVRASGTNWTNTRSTETDENGRFVIEGLVDGEYQLFAHSAAIGAFVTMDKKIRVAAGSRTEIDVDLRSGARISGLVVDAKGVPVGGAFIKFVEIHGDDQGVCTSDVAGHFSCASMAGGAAYRAEVSGSEASPAPYAFVGTPPMPIVLRDGDAEVDDLRLVVEARTLTIKGFVVDRSGQPIADVRVFANAGTNQFAAVPTSVTNLRGAFELSELSPGTYSLQIVGVDGGKATVDGVMAGTANVRVTLESPSCDESIDANVGRVLTEAPKDIANRPAARVVWENSIELVGWDIPARVHAGQAIQLVLVYRVLEPLDRSWKVFVHADGPKQRANGDHEPLGGRCPTSTWKPGDIIVDRTEVRIDPSYDRGTYAIWTGFFSGWAPSWRNLALSDAPSPRDEFGRYRLTTVNVE